MRSSRASLAKRAGRSCVSTGWVVGCVLSEGLRERLCWELVGDTSALAYGVVLAHNGGTARTPPQPDAGRDGLAHRVLHDPLTDLPNRTLFLDRLALALARLHRH